MERFGDVWNLHPVVIHKTMHALPYHAQAFLNGFLEGASDGHHLAYALHAGAQLVVHAVELGEVPTRNLANDIVEGRFKEGAGGLGDGVFQFK